jgi:hypothetical protein
MDRNFLAVVRLKVGDVKNGTAEEFVLRFFAFLVHYKDFDHSVKDFLNDYMKANSSEKVPSVLETIFKKTFALLKSELQFGIARGNRGITPVNLYEGIAVGTALAIRSGKRVRSAKLSALLDDEDLRLFTTGATNSKKAVLGRIEHVRNALVG